MLASLGVPTDICAPADLPSPATTSELVSGQNRKHLLPWEAFHADIVKDMRMILDLVGWWRP